MPTEQDNFEEIKRIFQKGRIDTKKELYLLYENNMLGNKPITWNSYEDIIKSEWKGNVCVRHTKTSYKNKVKYDIPIEELENFIFNLEKDGICKKDLHFNQSMRDERLTIQGELTRNEWGLDCLYTQIKKPMNIALREEEKSTWGLKAKFLLESYADPSSYSDIKDLFDIFPDSIIEFSCYEINVGTIPNRNTIIWEVRNF